MPRSAQCSQRLLCSAPKGHNTLQPCAGFTHRVQVRAAWSPMFPPQGFPHSVSTSRDICAVRIMSLSGSQESSWQRSAPTWVSLSLLCPGQSLNFLSILCQPNFQSAKQVTLLARCPACGFPGAQGTSHPTDPQALGNPGLCSGQTHSAPRRSFRHYR